MTPNLSSINSPDLAPAEADSAHEHKAPFVAPLLTCHGAVADLTQQFGGSLTPDERAARGLDY